MKKQLAIVSILLCIISFSFTNQFVLTGLKVTVRDNLGNLASGVKVTLYENKEDYDKSLNPVGTQTTDAKGNAVFDKLKPIIYYVNAEKGDKNNFNAGEKTEVLKENRQNRVTIIISE
ncbi:MAG: hypothetical protein H7259_09715 [Cytophagales bacterium]|nr:hypothetical protein [Cytophaga sp.]